MPSPADIVRVARTYLGTPFHHQGRVKGHGIDCIGLVVGVAKELGLPHHDLKGYAREPDGITIMREIPKSLDEIAEAGIGDVWVFKFGPLPSHAGIRTDIGMIHTYSLSGKVVEHPLNSTWTRRICGSFTWRQ